MNILEKSKQKFLIENEIYDTREITKEEYEAIPEKEREELAETQLLATGERSYKLKVFPELTNEEYQTLAALCSNAKLNTIAKYLLRFMVLVGVLYAIFQIFGINMKFYY